MFGSKKPKPRKVRDLSELMNVSRADMEKIANAAG